MSEESRNTEITEQETEKSSAEASHIREIAKKKAPDKKAFFLRAVFAVILGIAAGLIAAVVFVTFLPTAMKLVKRDEPEPVVISSAEESTSFSSDEPPVTAESSNASETEAESTQEEPEPVIMVEKDLEIADYTALMHSLMAVADEAQASVTDVSGIDSRMDYFNNTRQESSSTAGLIIAENEEKLFILTAYETIKDTKEIMVTFCDNGSVMAELIRQDENTNLAVISAEKADIPNETASRIRPAKLGSTYNVRRGDAVMAVGRPLGYPSSVAIGNVTAVSGMARLTDIDYSLFYTDIPASEKGSGILLDTAGEVVGIIAIPFAPEKSSSVTAIGISALKALMEDLSNGTARPYFGIKGAEVTAALSARTDIPMGLLVTEVEQDSPAMLAGLMEMDVILSLAGEETGNMTRFTECLRRRAPGEEITVKAARLGNDGYKEIEFSVVLGEI